MRDGPREFRQDSSCPALLRIPLLLDNLTGTGLSPSAAYLSRYFPFLAVSLLWSYDPAVAVTTTVWALPISLATTLGIDLSFSSSGY